MDNNSEHEDDLAADIIGEGTYEAARPLKKAFLPWHRPRKQYVRERQWIFHIRRALKEFKKIDDEPLRYLGLPGVDLLDLRYIHERVCEEKKLPLLFLGFNTCNPHTDAGAELNISLTEVRALPQVVKDSDVIGADFRQIGVLTSKAYQYAKKTGPYDVVNLDLCDCFAAESPDKLDTTHYDAMKGLITFQGRRAEPWLLFLTTRGGSGDVHPGVLSKLANKYKANLEQCAEFRTASNEHLKIDSIADVDAALQAPRGEVDVFLTALCKWLLGEALANMPPTTVQLLGVLEYQVNERAKTPDLFSIALKFAPGNYVPPDALGLARPAGKKPTECEHAPALVPGIALRKDVDATLSGDPNLHEEMSVGMESLLVQARYDGKAFRAWVAEGCPVHQF
ncbi:hypothetical protein SAMN04487926_16121 [Paraburkholderia steynii]|uniref:Uncharacterized protein n=1 Tax=Paraburkholderia steynii TaxID=1245441 RepID=A0A7Z7BN74_9BURK|nr:hypothetical protein [Paraburkholderia steynii]SDJ54626.1 hypothetical protein SAMN04487926_16121 [Paraburkholderia steynii]